MRLIDGDELLEILRIMQEVYFDRRIILGKVVGEVKRMPTIDPVRKGRKINQHSYPAKWLCSECGAKHFDFSDKFCSECGVNVEEGEQE